VGDKFNLFFYFFYFSCDVILSYFPTILSFTGATEQHCLFVIRNLDPVFAECIQSNGLLLYLIRHVKLQINVCFNSFLIQLDRSTRAAFCSSATVTTSPWCEVTKFHHHFRQTFLAHIYISFPCRTNYFSAGAEEHKHFKRLLSLFHFFMQYFWVFVMSEEKDILLHAELQLWFIFPCGN